MSRRKTTRTTLDESRFFGSVIVCPRCHWREWHTTPGRAWFALARHFKDCHDDAHAAQRAYHAAGWHKRKE